MKPQLRAYILIICAAALASLDTDLACRAQTTSTWRASGTSTDWFDSVNWTSGVPLLPGAQPNCPRADVFSDDRLNDFGFARPARLFGDRPLRSTAPAVSRSQIRGGSGGMELARHTLAHGDDRAGSYREFRRVTFIGTRTNSTFTFTSGFGSGNATLQLNAAGVLRSRRQHELVRADDGQLRSARCGFNLGVGSTSAGTVINAESSR